MRCTLLGRHVSAMQRPTLKLWVTVVWVPTTVLVDSGSKETGSQDIRVGQTCKAMALTWATGKERGLKKEVGRHTSRCP